MKRGYEISKLDDVIRHIAKGDQQQKLFEEFDDLWRQGRTLGEIKKASAFAWLFNIQGIWL